MSAMRPGDRLDRPLAPLPAPAENDGRREAYVVLGLVLLGGGHAYGYDLTRQFEPDQPLGNLMPHGSARLYYYLQKLRDRDWLVTRERAQHARPARHCCQLTEAGRAAFWRWLDAPTACGADAWRTVLVKLFFLDRLAPERSAGVIEAQRAGAAVRVDGLQQELATEDDRMRRLALTAELIQTEALLRWLDSEVMR